MRKIVHRTANHNIVRPVALAPLLALLILNGLAGCNDPEAEASAQKAAAEPTTRNCQVTVNSRPWAAFVELADRLAAGQTVSQSELEAYGELPGVTAWRHSHEPPAPSATKIATLLEGAWQQELRQPATRMIKPEQRKIGRFYRYSQSHGPEITALLAESADDEHKCRLRELIDKWLGPDLAPRALVLNVLPTTAEIRISEGEIFVDTSVLQAGGVEQTIRQIVSLLYRHYDTVSGANPIESDGEQAVAECIRVMMNEGVVGWIEKTTQTEFGNDHPTLGDFHIIPEDYFRGAQQTVGRFASRLPAMLADPEVMTERGRGFARAMGASGAFTQMGIAMAEVIVGRLGEERLQHVRHSVPDFFAAYQEAARLNLTPIPEPGTDGISLYESVMPLDEDLFEPLHRLLIRQVGAQ